MNIRVFVRSIVEQPTGGVIVTATNGSLEGPPSIQWSLVGDERASCVIGKAYNVTVESVS